MTVITSDCGPGETVITIKGQFPLVDDNCKSRDKKNRSHWLPQAGLHLERNDTAIYRGIAQNRIGSDFSRSIARWNILPANQRSLRHTASRSAGLIGFLQRVVFFRMEFSTRFNTSANCAWDIRKYAWNLSSSEWSSRTSLWYSPSCDLFRKVSCTQKRRFF